MLTIAIFILKKSHPPNVRFMNFLSVKLVVIVIMNVNNKFKTRYTVYKSINRVQVRRVY